MHRLPIFLTLLLIGGCTREEVEKPPLFSLLPPERTGIDFANTIREDSVLNVLEFEYLYNGGGVGVGDFNLDGRPDIVLAGNHLPTKVYLNQGDFRFTDVTERAGISSPYWNTGVAIGDLNGDGRDDIYLCNISPYAGEPAPNQFFLNRGSRDGLPVFEEAAGLSGLTDSAYSTQAAFLDYDLDGDLDVYLLRNALEDYSRNSSRPKTNDGSAASNDRLFRNDGNDREGRPRFTEQTVDAGIQAGGWGLGVGVTDFNEDGYPDIYCANDFLSNDLLWINQGDGTFRNEIASCLPYQSHNSMGVDIADYDNDGLPDLVTVDMMPEDNLRQKTMFPPANYNNFDLNLRLSYEPQFVRNMLYRNEGNGHYTERGQLAGIYATDWSWAPLLADLDNNGYRDLYITNGYVKDITNLDFLAYNQSNDLFGQGKAMSERIAGEVGGLEGVNKPNRTFSNTGRATFSDRSSDWGLDRPSYSNGAAYADLDGDGDLDLVVNNLNAPAFVYRNESPRVEGAFLRLRLRSETGASVLGSRVRAYAGDTSWVAEHYRVRGYLSTSENAIHLGLGRQRHIDSIVVTWPNRSVSRLGPTTVNQVIEVTMPEGAIADTEVLSRPRRDVALLSGMDHEENRFFDFDSQPLLHRQFSRPGPVAVTGDWNADGLDDLIYDRTIYLHGHGGGYDSIGLLPPTAGEAGELLVFDADGDGDRDILRVAAGSEWPEGSPAYEHELLLNNGKLGFTVATSGFPSLRSSSTAAVLIDLDGDGDRDVFIGGGILPGSYPQRPASYVLLNESSQGRASFRAIEVSESLPATGMVNAALAVDIDGDTRKELLVGIEFGPIAVFHWSDGKLQKKSGGVAGEASGWWRSLVAADFDGDGDQDIVAGNYGLNNRFAASHDTPLKLHLNDFDGDGSADPILTRWIAGAEYPVAPRDLLTKRMPGLLRRFPSYSSYGRADFDGLFTPGERRSEVVYESTELASLYLENDGGGNFTVKPLPVTAQLAPINYLLVDDWNKDGHPDLIAATGNRSGNTRLGYTDGYPLMVLLNNGMGEFSNASPPPFDWRSITESRRVIRTIHDGRPAYLLVQNDGPAIVYPAP